MSVSGTKTFPKSARLLKRSEFFLQPCRRFQTEHFRFFYTPEGGGRLGVSLSKKVLKHSVARNRVRRLLREVFRHSLQEISEVDVHVIGREELKADWMGLKRAQVEKEFTQWKTKLQTGAC